jgi:hypothetical protein
MITLLEIILLNINKYHKKIFFVIKDKNDFVHRYITGNLIMHIQKNNITRNKRHYLNEQHFEFGGHGREI